MHQFNSDSTSQPNTQFGRLHPLWSFVLMSFCTHGALFMLYYALAYGPLTFGVIVAGVLLLGAVLVYRTS